MGRDALQCELEHVALGAPSGQTASYNQDLNGIDECNMN